MYIFKKIRSFFSSEPETAEEWLEKGHEFYEKNQLENAVKCYEKVTTNFNMPRFSEILFRDAISSMEEITEKKPEYSQGWRIKGQLLGMDRQFEKSLECFDKALEINPEDYKSLRLKGQNLGLMDRHESALQYFDKALEINPEDLDSWCGKGNTFLDLGNLEESIKCFNKALDINPKHEGSWRCKAGALMGLGKLEEASKCIDESLSIRPENDHALRIKKEIKSRLSEKRKSEKRNENKKESKELNIDFSKLREEAPEVAKFMKERLQKTRDRKIDMDQIEKMAKEQPTHRAFQDVKNPEEFKWRHLALSAFIAKDEEKAIEFASKGLEVNPESPYLLYIRGRSRGLIGRFEKGIEDLNKAIELDSRFAEAYVERGYIKLKLGKEDGQKDYEKAKELEPLIPTPDPESDRRNMKDRML